MSSRSGKLVLALIVLVSLGLLGGVIYGIYIVATKTSPQSRPAIAIIVARPTILPHAAAATAITTPAAVAIDSFTTITTATNTSILCNTQQAIFLFSSLYIGLQIFKFCVFNVLLHV